MTTIQPIGVFDSGYGGLTILDEIIKEFPSYDLIYLGDNARNPYGTRSFEVVYEYTLEAVKTLFDFGCPLIILACNTASAKALRSIQQKDLPGIAPYNRVLGVIRPSVEMVGKLTSTGHVGVLATEGTVSSDSYPIEINKLFPHITTVQEACPMWVPLVENNELTGSGTEFFVKKNIENLLQKDSKIDTIILGCTHYPLLLPVIQKFVPGNIKIISQGKIVSESLQDYLKRHPEIETRCTKQGTRRYLTTENPILFDQRAQIFVDHEIRSEHIILKSGHFSVPDF